MSVGASILFLNFPRFVLQIMLSLPFFFLLRISYVFYAFWLQCFDFPKFDLGTTLAFTSIFDIEYWVVDNCLKILSHIATRILVNCYGLARQLHLRKLFSEIFVSLFEDVLVKTECFLSLRCVLYNFVDGLFEG